MPKPLKNFSELSKNLIQSKEKKVAPKTDPHYEEKPTFEYSFPSQKDSVSEEEIKSLKQALAKKEKEFAAAKEHIRYLEETLAKGNAIIESLKRENASLTGDNARLTGEAKKAESKAASETKTQVEIKETTALLAAPALPEAFAGEFREILLEELKASLKNATSNGRLRRAVILEAVIQNNSCNNELQKRVQKIRQILKEAGSFTDLSTLAALKDLGIESDNGRHWKLRYMGLTHPLPKTPSDHRSLQNSTKDIEHKFF